MQQHLKSLALMHAYTKYLRRTCSVAPVTAAADAPVCNCCFCNACLCNCRFSTQLVQRAVLAPADQSAPFCTYTHIYSTSVHAVTTQTSKHCAICTATHVTLLTSKQALFCVLTSAKLVCKSASYDRTTIARQSHTML
jgi:hypothetical protein